MDKEKVQIKTINDNTNTLYYVGEEHNIENGLIDPRLKDQPLEAKDYLFGMEFASPQGIDSVGEAIIIANNCFATSTDKDPKKHLSVIYGPKVYTPKFIALKKNASPNGYIRCKSKMPIIDFYSQIHNAIEHSQIALVGLAKFDTAYVNASHHPPIHGKSFQSEKKHYFPFPSKKIHNCFGVYVGLLTSKKSSKTKDRFRRYIDEYSDSSIDINVRSHLMILSTKHYEYNIIDPEAVTQVWHIFNEHSVISEFKGDFFLIDDLKHILDR